MQPKVSPRAQQTAESLTNAVLEKLHQPVLDAALHAIGRMGDEASARMWLEQRITRKVTQVFEQVSGSKSQSTPPPSGVGKKEEQDAPVTQTIAKAPSASPAHKPKGAAAHAPASRSDAAATKGSVPPRAASKTSGPPPSTPRPATPLPAATKASGSVPPPPPSSAGRSTSPSSAPKANRSIPPPPPPSPSVTAEAAGKEPAARKDSTPPPPSWGGRDDLNTLIPSVTPPQEDLFRPLEKRLTALRFMDAPEEAAELILDLAVEVAPSVSALVHRVDAAAGEAVAIVVRGPQAAALSDWSTEVHEPLVQQLGKLRRPIRIPDPGKDERCKKGRFALLSPKKQVVLAPAISSGKLVGFIELVDPKRTREFAQNQVDALEDLAKEWAKVLSS